MAAAAVGRLAGAILAASHPSDSDAPGTWPAWARLLPHLLVLDPAATSNQSPRRLARLAARYLILRGDARGGHDLADRLYQRWQDSLDPDDLDTLEAGSALSWGGHEVSEALTKYLERCSLAVCVLTAEDFTNDGRKFARQSVIHEVGLFQGQHGFDRVVLLVEEGCDFVPQAAAPYTIYFPHNRINRTFYQLAEIIKSQGFPAKEAS